MVQYTNVIEKYGFHKHGHGHGHGYGGGHYGYGPGGWGWYGFPVYPPYYEPIYYTKPEPEKKQEIIEVQVPQPQPQPQPQPVLPNTVIYGIMFSILISIFLALIFKK